MTLQIQSILIIILLKTFKCIIMSYLISIALVDIIINVRSLTDWFMKTCEIHLTNEIIRVFIYKKWNNTNKIS